MTEWQRKLYFGDNLDILREYVAEERSETPLYPPASGGKGIAAGRSVDGGRSETPLYPSVSGGKGQDSVRSLPACGEGRVGSRPVEELRPGDSVYSHDGQPHHVVRTFRRRYRGTMIGLRHEQSPATLWLQLRSSQPGEQFRRQHPIGPYIVDFYARASGLVIVGG